MAEFARFISYLYDYRAGERNRNLGFAKVEVRQGRCRLTVRLNHGQVPQQDMMLCGYLTEAEQVYLVRLGEMERGTGERRWEFPADNLGGCGLKPDQLSGLILISGDREFFLLSVWKDEERKAEEIRGSGFWNRQTAPHGTPEGLAEEENDESDYHTRYQIDRDNDQIAMGQMTAESGRDEANTRSNEANTRSGETDTQSNKAESAVEREDVTGQLSAASAASAPEAWRVLCGIYPAARPFEPSAWEVLCISLQDIGRLPPENWIWGSNHFLLHGFYQYHHLILARNRVENRVYLGVPGEFGTNEKFMAAMFGLHQFQRERQGKNDKGYWLTPIRLS